MISQIILDHTKLTPGHITSLLVVLGAFLDSFHIYYSLIQMVGGGAQLPITSFGHSLTHAALMGANKSGFIGLFTGMFDLTSAGISGAIRDYFGTHGCVNMDKDISLIFYDMVHVGDRVFVKE